MTAKLGSLKHPVMASWIRELGCRLDAPPFVSGALEARKTIELLRVRKQPVSELVRSGNDGVFHAGRVARLWVKDDRFGTKFLSGTDAFQTDLSNLALISNNVVRANGKLLVHSGWILITRSGTVGRTVLVRDDMDGMAATEDVLRVVPNETTISPGYLYAFLCSKYGVPVVVSGTYGSIIQHLEPEHILPIQVPRFSKNFEQKVHSLVCAAATKKANASEQRDNLRTSVEKYLKWIPRTLDLRPSTVSASLITRRLDGFYHSPTVGDARNALANHPDSKSLSDVIERVFEPNRSARRKVSDPAFGVPFLSSSSFFRIEPVAEYLVSKRMPHLDSLLLTDCDVLLPRSGQLGGIIGRAVLPLKSSIGSAASEHLVRIRCKSSNDAHYVWAILATQAGYYSAIATAFGTSIPSLDCELLMRLSIPWNIGEIRQGFIGEAKEIHTLLNDAIFFERKAISLVEQAIEENA